MLGAIKGTPAHLLHSRQARLCLRMPPLRMSGRGDMAIDGSDVKPAITSVVARAVSRFSGSSGTRKAIRRREAYESTTP